MKKLPMPSFDVKHAVEVCAAGITNQARAQALLDALPVIQQSEIQYLLLGHEGRLFEVEGSNDVTEALDADLMKLIYKSHFVRSGSASRHLYDQIRMAPAFGICPLCDQRIVSTLDHYLPQALHPRLNLTPANLLPACTDCNKAKLAKFAGSAEEQTLHPYFDDLGRDRWLFADILSSTPPTVSYAVHAPATWNEVLKSRVRHHFRTMGLGPLYAAQAASELADIAFSIRQVGDATGPDGVRSHLNAEYQSRLARNSNSWKTALYEGLRDSDWFCESGYLSIRT